MLRVPIWATAFVLVASASLAAPSLDAPMRAPRPEQPTLSEDWSPEPLLPPADSEMTAEGVQIARKGRGGGGGGGRGGGGRGGSSGKSRGGFKSGNQRSGHRGGEPGRPGRVGDPGGIRGGHHNANVNRNVNVDRDVNVHGGGGGGWDDDDNEVGAAILGGVVGMGIGSMINNSPN